MLQELLQINSKLKEELEESQQTIDGIEIEAEQVFLFKIYFRCKEVKFERKPIGAKTGSSNRKL